MSCHTFISITKHLPQNQQTNSSSTPLIKYHNSNSELSTHHHFHKSTRLHSYHKNLLLSALALTCPLSRSRGYNYHKLRDNTNHPASNSTTQNKPSTPLPQSSTQHPSILVPHPIFLLMSSSHIILLSDLLPLLPVHFFISLTNPSSQTIINQLYTSNIQLSKTITTFKIHSFITWTHNLSKTLQRFQITNN